MTKTLRRAMQSEKERLAKALENAKPGTAEYNEIQKELGAFAIMEQKDREGKMTAADWTKLAGTLVTTGLVVTADQWFPQVASKIRLGEFVTKLFK